MRRRLLTVGLCLVTLFALFGCEQSTSPDPRAVSDPVPLDGQLDPAAGSYTLKAVEGQDGMGRPLRLALVAKNLVVDADASTVSIDVAVQNHSEQTLHPSIVVWLNDFVPASVVPINADLLPPATIDPILGPWGYSYDERLGEDELLSPGELSGFSTWTFYDPELLPFRFRATIDFALAEAAARLGGRIFEDSNFDGLPSVDEPSFGAGVVFVTGPSDRTAIAEVREDGSYSVRVAEAGLYSLLYLPPPTFRFAPLHFTTPNPLHVLLSPDGSGQIADYLEAHFGIAPGGAMIRPIEFSEKPPMEIPSDHFGLLEVGLRGQILHARVGFSGCSPDHPFRLVMSGGFQESNPVGAQIVLSHDARGEMCAAYFEETRGFDLGPLVARYREQYGRLDPIRLVLWANGQTHELLLEPTDPNAP